MSNTANNIARWFACDVTVLRNHSGYSTSLWQKQTFQHLPGVFTWNKKEKKMETHLGKSNDVTDVAAFLLCHSVMSVNVEMSPHTLCEYVSSLVFKYVVAGKEKLVIPLGFDLPYGSVGNVNSASRDIVIVIRMHMSFSCYDK